MAKKKKEVRSDEKLLGDIALAEKLLVEGNKKLTLELKRYEQEITLLHSEIAGLKEQLKKKRIDKILSENQQLVKDLKKAHDSEHKSKELMNALHQKLLEKTGKYAELEKAFEIAKEKLTARNKTLKAQEKASEARARERSLVSEVNKRLDSKVHAHNKELEDLQDQFIDKKFQTRRLMRIVEKISRELAASRSARRVAERKLAAMSTAREEDHDKVEQLKEQLEHARHKIAELGAYISETDYQNKERSKLIGLREKELAKADVEAKLLKEELGEKERLLQRLSMAFETKKHEAQVILQMNKKLIEKDKALNEDQRRAKELMLVKTQQAKQQTKAVKDMVAALKKEKQTALALRKKFEELTTLLSKRTDQVRTLENDLANTHTKMRVQSKKLETQTIETDAFKTQIKNLFGTHKELEEKNLRFTDYLEKLRAVLYAKSRAWHDKEKEYEKNIAALKQETKDKVRGLLKADTNQLISLKGTIIELKQSLKEKEKQLLERDIREREMVLALAQHTKRWFGDEEQPSESLHDPAYYDKLTEESRDALEESIRLKERQIKQDIEELRRLHVHNDERFLGELDDSVFIAEKEVVYQTPAPAPAPRERAPSFPRQKIQRPRTVPINQIAPPQPIRASKKMEANTEHQDLLKRAKEQYMPNKEKLAQVQSQAAEEVKKQQSKALFIEGTPKELRKDNKLEFVENKKSTPSVDMSVSYSRGNPLMAMVDVGLQQGDDINTIRESLIKTGYEEEEVDRVIAVFKRGKLGSL